MGSYKIDIGNMRKLYYVNNGSCVVTVRTNVKVHAYIQDKHMHIYIHVNIGICMRT